MKRVLMWLVWFIVIYFGSCMLIGFFAGAMAGAQDPAHAHEAGRAAAEQLIRPNIVFILGGAMLLAIVGTVTGFLPGTAKKRV